MLIRAFITCLSLLFLVACGEKKEHSDTSKPLIVITSPDNPPFEFKDTAQGGDKVIGFDIDVIHALGERLGRPIKIVEAEFSSLIPALQSGRADIAIACLGPTEERQKSVDFSTPYYVAKNALLVMADSSIASKEDLADKRIGVQLGSAHEAKAKAWQKDLPHLTITSLSKVGELVQELKNNRVDAVLTEDTVGQSVAEANPTLKVVKMDTTGGEIAIAFPKGSPLKDQVNKVLPEMQSEIEKLAQKWHLHDI